MDWDDAEVKCPFYASRQQDEKRIKCEGPVSGTTTQIVFKGSKKAYLKCFCQDQYTKCRVYGMLIAKY